MKRLSSKALIHLEESKERFRDLFDFNMIGIALSDFEDKIFDANDAFLRIIGYTRKDLEAGRVTWSNISPKKYEKLDLKKLRELYNHGTIKPFEKEYRHKNGRLIPIVVGATRIREKTPLLGLCFALDTSQQKEVERKKDEFLGTVSHELKTPIAVLKMQVSLLEHDIKHRAPRTQLLQSIHEIDQQIDQLNILVMDLLNLAQLRTEDVVSRTTVFDIQDCVRKVVNEFELVTNREIILSDTDSPCLVRGNGLRMAQVFTNLISNALRYSPEHTRVRVTIRKMGKRVRICVKDFGNGIEKKDLQNIFKRYYRAKHPENYTLGSAGIGLHISNEIVRQHKGVLEVTSRVGKGTTFCCILPIRSR